VVAATALAGLVAYGLPAVADMLWVASLCDGALPALQLLVSGRGGVVHAAHIVGVGCGYSRLHDKHERFSCSSSC
jgi:hypothetical protein